jgi:hypothetical protein
MDVFTHLSVPISIILGLAMTELLTRIGRIIQCRKRVTFYWLPLAWAVVLMVIIVQSWWAVFNLKDVRDWTFFSFLVVLLHPVALFLLVALALPDRDEFIHGSVDLKAHYFEQRRWFFAAVLLTIAASLARPLAVGDRLSLNLDVLIQGFLFLCAVGGVVIRAEWFHRLLVIVFAATLAAYVGLLFVHL